MALQDILSAVTGFVTANAVYLVAGVVIGLATYFIARIARTGR